MDEKKIEALTLEVLKLIEKRGLTMAEASQFAFQFRRDFDAYNQRLKEAMPFRFEENKIRYYRPDGARVELRDDEAIRLVADSLEAIRGKDEDRRA